MEPSTTVDDVQACRSCLSTNGKFLKISKAYRKMYESISGLQISKTDGFPNYFCALCCTQMKKTIAFRKKCRRAYFVLKEISFRHKVAFESIAQVDLKKTNLLPSYDVWTLDNCAFYNMCESGGDASAANDGCQTEVVVFTGDDGNKNPICIVTDIKPDNWREIEEEEKRLEECKRMEEAIELSLAEHEHMGDDGADDNVDVEPEFDMEDMFKDFKEEIDEDDFEWPLEGIELPFIEKTVIENEQDKCINNKDLTNKDIMAVKVLEHCTIDTLTLEEQYEVWALRANMEPYKSALFKCSICLDSICSEARLKVHANKHAAEVKVNNLQCKVCKRTFGDMGALITHRFEVHQYKYTCNKCGDILYTWQAVMDHRVHKDQLRGSLQRLEDVESLKQGYAKQAVVGHTAYEDHLTVSLQRLENIQPLKRGYAKYPCNLCPYGAYTFDEHIHHLQLHVKSRRKKLRNCTICHNIFTDPDTLEKHMQNHRTIYTCNHCKTVFTSKFVAKAHVVSCAPAKMKSQEEELATKDYVGTTKDDARAIEDDVETTKDDADANEDDVGTTKDDAGENEDDIGTTTNEARANEDDIGTTTDEARANEDDIETTTDDARANEDDIGTTTDEARAIEFDIGATTDNAGENEDDIEATKDDEGTMTDDADANKDDIGAPKDDADATKNNIGSTKDDVVLTTKNDRCCRICGQQFLKKKHMSNHMALNHGQDAWSCPDCGFFFLAKANLFKHQLQKHRHINVPGPLAGLQEFECKECIAGATRFENAQALFRHRKLARHGSTTDNSASCPHCCKVFESTSLKERHRCRLKLYPRTCQCGFVAEKALKYILHRRKHHCKRMCEECGLIMTSESFKSHQELVHRATARKKDPFEIECRFCSYVSPSVNMHAWHVVKKHTPRPWQCALCDAAFCKRAYARVHALKTHAPVRPYQCAFCPRQFTLLFDYATHAADTHNADVRTDRMKKIWLTAMRNKRVLFTEPHVKVNVGLLEPEYQSQFVLNISDYTDMSVLPIPAEEKFNYLITECTQAPINIDPLKTEHIDWSNLVFPTEDEEVLSVENEQKAKKQRKINVKYAPVSVGSKDIVWSDMELPADDSKVMEGSKRVKKTKKKRVKRKVEKINAIGEDYSETAHRSKGKVKKRKSEYLGETAGKRGRDMMDLDILDEAVSHIVPEENVIEDDGNFLIQDLEDLKDEELEVDYNVIEEEVVAGPPLELFDNEGNPLDIIEDEGEKYVIVMGVMYKLELD